MTKMDKLYEIHKEFSDQEIVLDVRTEEEFSEGHVPGAINIPHEEVGKHIGKLKQYNVVLGKEPLRQWKRLPRLDSQILTVLITPVCSTG